MKQMLFVSRLGSRSAGFKDVCVYGEVEAAKMVPVFTDGSFSEIVAAFDAKMSWYNKALAFVLDNNDSYASSVILVERRSAE